MSNEIREAAIILDLCGGTGAWSNPYKEAGYDVRIVTLPEQDVRLYIPPRDVRGILAAPPCTHLASSGARWWAKKGDSALLEALSVVDACLRIVHVCNPVWWALENPVGRLRRYLGKPALIFDPYDYGDPWRKKSCLWGCFSEPARTPVEPDLSNEWIHQKSGRPGKCGGSRRHNTPRALLPDSICALAESAFGLEVTRAQLRSITPPGFARAFFEANP